MECGPSKRSCSTRAGPSRSRSRQTAIRPSSALPATMSGLGRLGCLPAATGYGRKGRNSQRTMRRGQPGFGSRARSLPPATPSSPSAPTRTSPASGRPWGPPRPVFSTNNLYPVGGTWVFARSNGVWTQQGQKLVGTGYLHGSNQGNAVALSGDGSTALIGGPLDNDPPSLTGAAWVFAQPAKTDKTKTHDFNGDGKSDIAWRDTSGNVTIGEMNGTTVLNPNTAGVGNVATTWSIVGIGDFNGDGKWDILWRDTGGNP